ncbi:MAG: M4 family metallopeptidase [Thermodesulfobacteriota bacterium]|nr:M4 family metallopeptidase [Thermodesulfobacteriota bacterium]
MIKIHGKSKTKKTLFIISFLLLILTALISNHVWAQEKAAIDSIKLKPLSKPQSISSITITKETPTDPRISLVRDWLRESINSVRSSASHSPESNNINVPRARSIRGHEIRNANNNVNVIFNSVTGTPRQIKGAVIEHASRGIASGSERDEKTARAFLRTNRGLLRINDPDSELKLCKRQTDHINRRHLRFSQRYNSIEVWPAELIVHLNQEGSVDLMNGAFVRTPRKIVTQPVLGEDDAIAKAREEIPGGKDAYVSDPALIIYAPNGSVPRLAWKLELSVSPQSNWLVVIDALNGATLTAYNQVKAASVAGSGLDLFGVNQSLNIWQEDNTLYMVDTSKNMYDATSDPPSPESTKGAIIVLDALNTPVDELSLLYYPTSGNASSGWLPDAVSLAYNLSETYSYYLERHNRNSIDDNGCSIVGVVRLGQNYHNAFWTSDLHMMFFGDGEAYAGALDIVAHELTHGVTSHTADLVYKDQSGALNESFSDIFGEMVDARTRGSADWLMPSVLQNPFRSLSDPSSIDIAGFGPYPSKMSEYIYTTQDNGGVHLNMTIVAHAFYLLAEGLERAIGIRDAERIFYRALAYHLVANSQLIDGRLACIASAEELFGKGSTQALKTAEAFDAVEIFEDNSTPDPQPFPAVSGPDAVLFAYYDQQVGGAFLGRLEEGDPERGVRISCSNVAPSRASVSGNGSFAVYLNPFKDICLVDTHPNQCETCLGYPGLVNSVAMSPDGNLFAFVFLDESGVPTNSINVINIDKDTVKTFELLPPPVFDGDFSIGTILWADAMDFTADGKFIIYDAFNIIKLTDGSQIGVWSIYAIDLAAGQTQTIVPPTLGLDIGYPALSHTNDNFITFDVLDTGTGESYIFTGNLNTGDLKIVSRTLNDYGIPGYTGDDTAIVFSVADLSAPTGRSLFRQPIAEDHITAVGNPELFLADSDFGVIYRYGTFVSPEANISVSPESISFGYVPMGNSKDMEITLSNTGSANLKISSLSITGANTSDFSIISGACKGQTLSPTGTCIFKVSHSPISEGAKSASLTILSDDPDTPSLTVSLTGIGIIPISDGDVAPLGNRDGTVNVGDALVALRFALNLETPSQEDIQHGDVAPLDASGKPDPDGEITVGDALVILRKALDMIQF